MSDINLNLPSTSAAKSSDSISVSAPTSPIKNTRLVPNKQTMNLSSSSATGNPRNKTALKPGHSLIDWIRLGGSGRDLAGTRGVITPVSHAELAKHNKIDDAWLAIRGKVYNVTHYFSFHPGGAEELMRGAGKDATKIFDEVHAWVNYEQLLAKCLVGPLQNTVTLTFESSKKPSATASLKSSPTNSIKSLSSFKSPFNVMLPPRISATPDSNPVDAVGASVSPTEAQQPEIVPRFDWIQKTTNISIIFYTKPFCDPGLIVECLGCSEIDIRILIERTTNLCKFKFFHDVRWPCAVKISNETGKIEITFTKSEPQLWTNFGILERRKITDYEMLQFDFDVTAQQPINHDSYALVLTPKNKFLIRTPYGHHLSITANVNNENVTRSYTPVPAGYVPLDCTTCSIALLVKSYDCGLLSQQLTRPLPHLSTLLRLSQPKGDFSLTKLKNHHRIALLAAGSGITPMLGLLDYLLLRSSNRVEMLVLYYFNKTLKDVWCREKLDFMEVKDDRLKIKYILSEPDVDATWAGDRGRISLDLVKSLTEKVSPTYVTYACICGPRTFNDVASQLFKEAELNTKHLYCFQG